MTSAAGINLGAIVTNTKVIATYRMHIKGTIIKSSFSRTKLSMKNRAKVATNNLPTTSSVINFLDYSQRIVPYPTATPIAFIITKISPYKFPNFK